MFEIYRPRLKRIIAILDKAIEEQNVVLVFKAAAELNLIIKDYTEEQWKITESTMKTNK